MFLLALFLSGCAQEVTRYVEETEVVNIETSDIVIEYSFDVNCDSQSKTKTETQLQSKVKELSKLEENYAVVNNGALDVEGTIFYGMHTMHESGLLEGILNVPHFEHLMSQIVEANFVGIESTNSKAGNFYPSAGIEEYVFSSSDCAEKAERYIDWVNQHGPWGTYYKAPTIYFREGNLIYHIDGFAEFMRSRLPIIETAIRVPEE